MSKNDNKNSGIDAKTQVRRALHAKRMGIAKARFESEDVQKMIQDRIESAYGFAALHPENSIDA